MMFCNDKIHSETREIWKNIQEDEQIVQQILAMRRTSSVPACLLMNSLILMHLQQSNESIHSLLLLIVSTKHLIALSMDPTQNFEVIMNHCDTILKEPNSANIILFLLAETLQITPIVHISKLMKILENLIVQKKLGHPLMLQMLLDGIIQVMAYPSFSNGKLGPIERLMNYIRNNKPQIVSQTSEFSSDFLGLNAELTNARDVSIMLESRLLTGFKPIATEAEKMFWTRNQLVLRGYFHCDTTKFEDWVIILKNLIEISKTNDALKSSLVMPLLFKLSSSSNPRMKLAILQNMIQLGATTEIFGTIKALSSTGLIRTMSIDLHLRLWKMEPRTYPFLHKALVEKSNTDADDFGLDIVRAAAIKDICDLRPQHGSDLISIISEILNGSADIKDGDIQASLAIDSITLLCQNHVINAVSTWKAISLTTRYEKRPRVIKSLCKFFALIPSLKRSSLDYENLVKEILGRLWHMIQWSDRHGIACAVDALKSWSYDLMTLDSIPETYREGIALPEAPQGMEVSILDLEVPGECFVQLLTKVHPDGLSAIGNLLTYYIGCEIAEFRSGHYLVKDGQPEPINYKNLPKQSILKALVTFVIQQATTKKADKLVGEASVIESLRILAQKYSRPLPPLNWCFLHDMLHKSDTIKVQCLRIAAKQSVISGTAKRLIENFLVNLDVNSEDDVKTALEMLVDLCNGVSSEVFKSFCEFIFRNQIGEVEASVVECLKHEKNVTNRENLAVLVALFIIANPVSIQVVRLVPPKVLDMISFQLSQQQKIEFRCEILKTNQTAENPIAWISELVTEQLMTDDNRDIFIKSFTRLLIDSDVFPKKKWLTDFIIMMQNRLVESDLEDAKIKFLLDVFIVSIIATSGYFQFLSNNGEIFEQRLQIVPKSIELVSRQHDYDDAMGKIFEFLLHIINRDGICIETREAFKTAIVISKNHSYFKKAKVWQKFLMMR